MKRELGIIGLVLVGILVFGTIGATALSYPLDGFVKFSNGTQCSGANVSIMNQRTGEYVYNNSGWGGVNYEGYYMANAGNFPASYIDGDNLTYYTTITGYENTSYHVINIPVGYNFMNITLHPSTFDTGKGTYPSIFGVHNGTIKPNQAINVSKLYTYPCTGTGGHSEYVWIHENGINVSASWDGYQGAGDYHYIEFSESFTLEANVTYNYTIKTGSYP